MSEFICSTIALACNTEPASVGLATNLIDLNMDSLNLVSVLTQVEAVYAVELNPEQTLRLLEASHVFQLVERLESIVGHARNPDWSLNER